MNDAYDLRTPEQVDLEYEVAGLGSRFIAILLDSLIQLAVMLAVVAVFALGAVLLGAMARDLVGANSTAFGVVGIALAVLLFFVVTWGYFIFFELVWNGQTPGKRAAGIRVLTTRGEPITLTHAFVRNLVRIVDSLPTSYMLGVAVMLATRRAQRLGDLAAGTMVVKEHRASAPQTLEALPPEQALAPQQAVAFTREDVALARDFLLRREALPAEQRRILAREIADRFRARLASNGLGGGVVAAPGATGSSGDTVSDEALLAKVAGVRR